MMRCLLVLTLSGAALCCAPTAKCGPKVARPITQAKTRAYEDARAAAISRPAVLLARPFDDGNVGGAARAMLNFGLCRLRLVDPTANPRSDEAILRATGAAPVLRDSETYDSMAEAVADLQLVLATTARPRESRIPVHSPREAVELAKAAVARGERVGFLFGSEKNGLSNTELEHATSIVTIPTVPGFSSLNLAQAVLLMCYEWSSVAEAADDEAAAEDAPSAEIVPDAAQRASQGTLESLFAWWEDSLWTSGFFGGSRAVKSAYGEDAGKTQEESRAAAAMGKVRRYAACPGSNTHTTPRVNRVFGADVAPRLRVRARSSLSAS